MCDTWNRERVPLTGPSGLGVPRPLGAGGLVHPPKVWEVLLRELGYGLLPAPPPSLGGHHALCPHPFHHCLDLRSPEEALETSPAPPEFLSPWLRGGTLRGRLTSSQVALMGSQVERPFPTQLRPHGPFQARGLEGRASESRATPNFPAPHAGGRGREGLLGRPSPSATCRQ